MDAGPPHPWVRFERDCSEQVVTPDLVRWERTKKTRPSAQYDACTALPCPDIKIGSRHPVSVSWRVSTPTCVIQFTMRQKYGAKTFHRRERVS